MKATRIILAAVLLAVIFAGVNYLRDRILTPEGSEAPSGGAAMLEGKHDIGNSAYFAAPDIYNMKPGGSLLLLPRFKTRQQQTGYTCGPAAAAMVAEYFLGSCPDSEMEIARIMETSKFNGTNVRGMARYFERLRWDVKTSADTTSPKNYPLFLQFVETSLRNNAPIIVENVEWGGHWRVIIGYDTMGTGYTGDDVLIMADPFDLADHVQDGYNIENAQKFYYMWFDAKLFTSGEREHPWLIARPKA